MNQDYKKRMEEREIDLMDLIYYISMHWRSILIAALVGMVALGALCVISSQQSEKKAKLSTIESAKRDLVEEYEADGKYDTEQKRKDRLALVETIAEQIKAYDALIDAQNEYLNGSVFARENVTNVYCRNLQYLITVDGNNMTYLDNLVDAYSGIIQSDEVYEKVADKTGGDVEKQFVAECFLIDEKPVEKEDDKTQKPADVNVVKVFNSSENNTIEENDEVDLKEVATILNVTLMGPNEDFDNTLATIVDDVIDKTKDELRGNVINHSISKINDNSYSRFTNDYAMKKSEAIGIIKAKMDDKTKITSSFTEIETFYAEMIVDEVKVKENEEETQNGSIIPKKMLAIGFIGGALALMLVWTMVYILSGYLMSAKLLERLSDVHTYSLCLEKKKKVFFDKWFTSWFDKTTYLPLETIVKLITVDVGRTDIKSLAIIGSTEPEISAKLVEEIGKELNNVELFYCGDIINNPDDKNRFTSSEGVIIVENVTIAKIGNVYNELADTYSKKLIGCVAIK